jgi:hypothetical protein
VPRAIELRRATRRALGNVAELLAALISGRNPA